MAVFAFTDGYIALSGTDMSSKVKKITLDVDVEDLDAIAMGGTYKSHIGGLKQGTLTLEFNQDFAASTVDAVIWPLLGTVVTFEVRPTSSAVGPTNPKYTGSVLVKSWTPVDGSVGDLAKVSVSWPTSGTVTRATS